ncbi:NADH-quinone oxidoreductase subunit L [Wohlfahrtiimonas chitiniclastica]|uniref:NADH-quinone oxidoreductase subunit L n=1 Tax=Wohlfahrtiimonas chitiniclastica TaxID=400946 RepID=UPI000B98A8D0|nr:NADH-quinone oxidoreductase subunit L [Wohlfahrtiimonas chitiniclastica]OYQ77140.1 NADH-quinone oxidoreductase subunit L [Wohlfahrtiimonas chitiniclastica]
MKTIYLLIAFLPLIGAAFAGLLCRVISNRMAHTVTIALVAVSAALSGYVLYLHGTGEVPTFNGNVYEWMSVGNLAVAVGFLVDNLTAMMLVVVTFVSLMVHIYSIGYMKGDPGYNRFFSYISLFTFSMLMLVMSNNLMQLFFGWEAVGLVSYLLIGFWFKRPTATYANMKAFIVNRVGDFGFIVGIACMVYLTGHLHYADIFESVKEGSFLSEKFAFLGTEWSVITFAAIFLFIGAMGKSAQVPLHVWLPDSMEGPTPISALIHAATMVTAGIFMVSRLSPIFELSDAALSFIMIIGAITALFMGILGIFQNDIKRVVAYSTLSQLGYMTVALGASAYSAAVFHLMTHAFFKALLFLAAGSVIIGMHHQQDMRFMGGLRKKMPITWFTCLIGTLALIGTPFFSGYFSKDAIILAVENSTIFGSGFAYFSVVASVFITAVYSLRLYFLVFHGKPRYQVDPTMGEHDHKEGFVAHEPHESPAVVTVPLILLAIPSLLVGVLVAKDFIMGTFLQDAITVSSAHPAMAKVAEEFGSVWHMGLHGFVSVPVWLAIIGGFFAWYAYLKKPTVETAYLSALDRTGILKVFTNKYYFDDFNQKYIADGAVGLGRFFWKNVDDRLIDQTAVYGSATLMSKLGGVFRKLQTGYLFHSAYLMAFGLVVLMTWVIIFK